MTHDRRCSMDALQTVYRPLRRRRHPLDSGYILAPMCVLAAMLVIAAFTGYWPWTRNPYNSYALQAASWLQGRLDLGQDYPWLELAIVDGRYFVSFPPFPSLVLLPFVLIFGTDTPDTLICWLVTLAGVVQAMRIWKHLYGSSTGAFIYVLMLFLSSGYLFIAQAGWVWFMAQTFCFTLSLSSILYMLKGRRGLSLTLWAFAVGCRPLIALFLPVLVILMRRRSSTQSWTVFLKKTWTSWIGVCITAAFYMTLNYLRFHNPLEFGHNYLPEFQTYGKQFSLSYVPEHLKLLLRLPEAGEDGVLRFDHQETYLLFLINPMYITYLVSIPVSIVERYRCDPVMMLTVSGLAVLHLFVTCMHRTLGGFQFGNRYLLDALPFLFLGILLWKSDRRQFDECQLPLLVLGAGLNILGTVFTYLSH